MCTDWDNTKFVGLGFARTLYPKMQGLKNARTRMVKESGDGDIERLRTIVKGLKVFLNISRVLGNVYKFFLTYGQASVKGLKVFLNILVDSGNV